MKYIYLLLPFILIACNQATEEIYVPTQDTSDSFSDTIPFKLDSLKGSLVIDSNGIDTIYTDTIKQ